MNAALIMLFGVVWLVFGYLWYGRFIAKKIVKPDDKRATPAEKMNDGEDYVPTKPWILFGHHFSSIAGAGPIVGPILALAWFGWGPALLWVLLGSVLLGAVHDYTALMVSVRNKAVSIVEVAEKIISPRAMAIFGGFVWLTMMLLQAVFADLTAKTLVEKPEIVLPTIGIIFIAILFGLGAFRAKLNQWMLTILALGGLVFLAWLGTFYPIGMGYHFWLAVVLIYALIASTLPVWLLLQPRDYLSVYILLAGLFLGLVGIFVGHLEMTAPVFLGFNSVNGPLFPILFITVACGAISGFHSLVASGTTAKQLDEETDGKPVVFGGMIVEGLLALLVIVMVSSALGWGEFQGLLGESANIVFGTALGRTVEALGIPLIFGTSFGILMLNAFILTSLDTSARLNRYVVQETLGGKVKGVFRNKYLASGASLLLAYFLCLSDGYRMIWLAFGASNQLIATITLFVVTVYFLMKKTSGWFTLIPAIFMLIVTETALIYQAGWQYWPEQNWLMVGISLILFVLGIAMAVEVSGKIKKYWAKTK